MYHPYQNLEAKRVVKERRETADIERRLERARADRTSLLSSLHAKLKFLLDRPIIARRDGDSGSHQAAIGTRTRGPRRATREAS